MMLLVVGMLGLLAVMADPLDKLTFSVPEAARTLGISRNLCYELIRAGELPCLRLGRKRLVVPKAALDAFLAKSQ